MVNHEFDGPEAEQLVVTRVERRSTNPATYDIYLNDRFACTVHEETLIALKLLKGNVLEREDLARIEREERICDAYNRAIRWLGRRPHAGREIERKLLKLGVEEETAGIVLDRLRRERLLDDQAYAEQLTDYRIRTQKKGRRWVRYELTQKGLAAEHIEAALRSIDPALEYEQALQLGRKKWSQTSGNMNARKRKTADYLMRRGFPAHIAAKVVRSCASGEDALEDIRENHPFEDNSV